MTDILRCKSGTPYGSAVLLGSNVTMALNESLMGAAAIINLPNDDTITHVGFLNHSVTGTATSITDDIYTIGIYGITGGGLVNIAGGASASATFPQAGKAGGVTLGSATSHIVALSSSVALQAGQYAVAITLSVDSLTHFITNRYGGTGGVNIAIPYGLTADTSGTWTRQNAFPYYWFMRSATQTYGYPGISFAANQTFGTTTEAGFTFTLPSGFGTSNTYGVRGIEFMPGTTGLAAGNSYYMTLYSSIDGATPSILQQTAAIDSDIVSATGGNRPAEILFTNDTLSSLVPGTKYGIGLSCTGATGWSLNYATLPAAGDRSAYPSGGFALMTRTLGTSAATQPPSASEGAFTETVASQVNAGLILAAFTAINGVPMSRIQTGM